MSLLNIIVERDQAHMLTDGGVFGPAGEMLATQQQKAFPLPMINAVIGLRSNRLDIALGVVAFSYIKHSEWKTFDCAIQKVLDFVQQTYARPEIQALGENADLEVAIMGWSETADQAQAYFFHTGESSPYGAFKIVQVDGIRLSPTGEDQLGRGIWPSSHPHFEQSLIAVADQQRASKLPPIVGGLLQLSTVKRSEITTRIIHELTEDMPNA